MTIDFTRDELKYIKATVDYDIEMLTTMLKAGFKFTIKEKKHYERLLSIKQKLEKKSRR